MTMARTLAKLAARKVQKIQQRKCDRVEKALSLTDYKASPRSLRSAGIELDDNKSGATCLQDVAIFAAGHRKPTETITAR